MGNSAVLAGEFTGLLIGLLIGAVVIIFANKNHKIKTNYDERQEMIRNKGFKYAFFALFGGNLLIFILNVADVELPLESYTVQFTLVALALVVYVTYAIMKDGYFGLNNNVASYQLIFAVLAILFIVYAVIFIQDKGLVENGKVGISGVWIINAFLMIWISVVIAIKQLKERKDE